MLSLSLLLCSSSSLYGCEPLTSDELSLSTTALTDRFGGGVFSLAGLLLATDEPLVVLVDDVDILFEPLLLYI
jgi:hypothetical protein